MDSPKGPGVKAMGGSPPEDVLRTILGEKALERRRNVSQAELLRMIIIAAGYVMLTQATHLLY